MIRRLLIGKQIKVSVKFPDECTACDVTDILTYGVCGEIIREYIKGETWYSIYVLPSRLKWLLGEAERKKISVVVED